MLRCLVFALIALMMGCTENVSTQASGLEPGQDDRMPANEVEVVISDMTAGVVESPIPFMQVGFIFDAEDPAIRFRVLDTMTRTWTDWDDAEITWTEDIHHVGRIILTSPASAIEIQRTGPVIDGKLEFMPEVYATDRLARDLPFETEFDTQILREATQTPPTLQRLPDGSQLRTQHQAVAPSSLVISRSGWGARNPGKICGSAHNPYRMTIHHTAAPSTDGSDPAIRMRQMQAYHIDSNGWCDLGYHFVTSQSGRIYQGRNHEGRVGAHTGNTNTGNVGISMIGNFEVQTLGSAQRDATVRITKWVTNTYGIAVNRTRIKGHKEWPGQSTACPGRNFMSQFNNFISRVNGATTPTTPTTPTPEPEPDPVYDIAHHVQNIVLEPMADLNADGLADICIRDKDGIDCRVSTRDGFGASIRGPELKDSSGWGGTDNYATIRAGDINGDGMADLCARANAGMRCWIFDGEKFGPSITGPAWSDDAGFNRVSQYATIQMPDINGDGMADLCARKKEGLECAISTGEGFGTPFMGPLLRDADGWDKPEYFGTIRFADINGDGKSDVCARNATTIRCFLSKGDGFEAGVSGPGWTNENGWDNFHYWSTIRLVDLDNDGAADICARAAAGILCHLADGEGGFGPRIEGPGLSNQSGWDDMSNYDTIRYADVTGDGRLDLCARANAGMQCWPFDGEKFGDGWSPGPMKDDSGWDNEQFYRTISMADINGDGMADVCARASQNYVCWVSTGSGFNPTLVAGPAWSNAAGYSDVKYYSTTRLFGPIRPLPPEPGPEEPGQPGTPPEMPGNNESPDPNPNPTDGEDVDWGDQVDPDAQPTDLAVSDGCSTSGAIPSLWLLLFAVHAGSVRVRRKRGRA